MTLRYLDVKSFQRKTCWCLLYDVILMSS